jgi:hypothetical protein
MIVNDAELTPYDEMIVGHNDDCEFCGRSMMARFGGIVGTNECPSCSDDFHRLNDAGKLEIVEGEDLEELDNEYAEQ